MAFLSVSMTTGQTFGTYVGGKLLMQFSAAQCALGAVVIQFLAFFYCLIFIPNTKPEIYKPTTGPQKTAPFFVLVTFSDILLILMEFERPIPVFSL
uniref:Uncharacterized protein n=1 Tax=Romanomermis culicivorax TaxID=13658 RepID=A0A915J5X5_ROMCU